MINSVVRRARQVLADPVLRRWLVLKALGRVATPPAFVAHQPPYLSPAALEDVCHADISLPVAPFAAQLPDHPITMDLAGARPEVTPEAAARFFDNAHDDLETTLSMHRFAWLQTAEPSAAAPWVVFLWEAWYARYMDAVSGWPWHPYTAAERAINLIDFCQAHGAVDQLYNFPQAMALHTKAIAAQLEYFGEHNTSNHLANNGRGLYRIGLEINDDKVVSLGCEILLDEAERILAPSGILNEGSSHYHLLYTQRYIDVWFHAARHKRSERTQFADIAQRMLAVAAHLAVNGRFPLIGDISPDCTPQYLEGLWQGLDEPLGWVGRLSKEEWQDLKALRASASSVDFDQLRRDGWLRHQHGRWTGLWHCSPKGWSAMPGHGHQNISSFELDFDGVPLIVDPGRDRYGDTDVRQKYVKASAHSGLVLNSTSPYPPNKPYYDDAFRESICGPAPEMSVDADMVSVYHTGYSRFSNIGGISRTWNFGDAALTINDQVEGHGQAQLTRTLQTALEPRETPQGIELTSDHHRFRIRWLGEQNLKIEPQDLWIAYGKKMLGWRIELKNEVAIPHQAQIVIEAL